jgi:hypothetical protein
VGARASGPGQGQEVGFLALVAAPKVGLKDLDQALGLKDLDDASGIEGEWRDPSSPLGPGLEGLLTLIGEVFLPYMVANAAADQSGAPTVSVTLRGMPFVARTAAYRSDCLGWLKLALSEALAAGAVDLEPTLRRFGCWDALQLEPGERETIPPMSPEATGRRSGLF